MDQRDEEKGKLKDDTWIFDLNNWRTGRDREETSLEALLFWIVKWRSQLETPSYGVRLEPGGESPPDVTSCVSSASEGERGPG